MPVAQDVISAGKWLDEALVIYDPKVTERIYPEYWAYEGKYHNAIGDLPIAATKIIDSRIDYTGKAVNYGGKATTIPLANFGIDLDEYKVIVGILAAEWTYMELKAQEMAQKNPFLPQSNVVESYMKALEKGLREWMHIRAVFGDAIASFTGMFNNPWVEVITITQDLYALTAQQLYDFFRLEIAKFRKSSKLTADATALMINEDLRSALLARFADNTGDGNPLRLLMNQQEVPSIGTCNVVNELDAAVLEEYGVLAAGTNKDMFMLYEQAEDTLDRRYADIEYTQPMLLDDGLTYRRIGLCATSEPRVRQPFRVKYYKYPKKS